MHSKYIRAGMLVLASFAVSPQALGQIGPHNSEVGVLFTSINLNDFREQVSSGQSGDANVKGFGGRFAYNFTEHLALDAEASFFSRSRLGNSELGQKALALAGLKAGVRKDRVGVFAKSRPGLMWFGDISSRGSCRQVPSGTICEVAHAKNFALDLGAIVEFYPSQRTIVRLDLGDTIVRYRAFANTLPAITKHNFQVSLGFGYRF